MNLHIGWQFVFENLVFRKLVGFFLLLCAIIFHEYGKKDLVLVCKVQIIRIIADEPIYLLQMWYYMSYPLKSLPT